MIQKWQTVDSKTVFEHSRLKLVEDTVELPDGKRIKYLCEHSAVKESVAVIALDNKHRILLQKEYSYPPDAVLWQLPGGAMNEGEGIIETAKRELREESGVTAKHATNLGWFFTKNRRSDQKQHVVVCTGIHEAPLPSDPEEFIESTWVTKKELDKLLQTDAVHNMNLLAALQLLHAKGFWPQ